MATSGLSSSRHSSTLSGSSTSSALARRRAERERERAEREKERERERQNFLMSRQERTTSSSSRRQYDSQLSSSSTGGYRDSDAGSEEMRNTNIGEDQRDEECIGFATLPDQIHRKVIKKGFHFTIMVVGESGLGKSTLINSLFMTDLYQDRKPLGVEDRIESTTKIESQNLDIEEAGVKLRLTIIDSPGFSDSLNGEDSIKPVEEYIDKQFQQYYKAESGLNRKNIQDSRVHCLLYFVSACGHGLKPIDVECMKRLHHKVNIIPVIGKSDTLTKPEIIRHKIKVLEDIRQHGIRVYDFPDCDPDETSEFKRQDAELKASLPFAVIGSNVVTGVNGKRVRARIYPWGIIEVENESHSDFSKLKRMLIGTHLQDLKDTTEEVHYENYRAQHIQQQSINNNNLSPTQAKADAVISKNGHKVEQLLNEKDEEIKKMQAMLEAMQRQMAAGAM